MIVVNWPEELSCLYVTDTCINSEKLEYVSHHILRKITNMQYIKGKIKARNDQGVCDTNRNSCIVLSLFLIILYIVMSNQVIQYFSWIKIKTN